MFSLLLRLLFFAVVGLPGGSSGFPVSLLAYFVLIAR